LAVVMDFRVDRPATSGPRPNFFLVGAPKSGTTALFEYLELHPQVFVPIEKEPHFFAPDMYAHTTLDYTLEQYLALFAEAGDRPRIGEASALYLSSKVAPARLKNFCPDAKILINLRNPVDMVWGFHLQTSYSGTHVLGDPRPPMAAARYEFLGFYATQVERYFSLFGRENVHVQLFDDFQKDPRKEFLRVLEFLGLRTDCVPEKLHVANPYKEVRSRWLKTVMDHPPHVVRKLVRSLPRKPYRDLMAWLQRQHSVPSKKPQMAPELRRHLEALYRPEVARLSVLLDRDLSGWMS
jgi:Sulfotransferase domain